MNRTTRGKDRSFLTPRQAACRLLGIDERTKIKNHPRLTEVRDRIYTATQIRTNKRIDPEDRAYLGLPCKKRPNGRTLIAPLEFQCWADRGDEWEHVR